MGILSGAGFRAALSKETTACTLSAGKGHVLPISLQSGFGAWPRQLKGTGGEVGTGQQPRPTGRGREESGGPFTIPLDHTLVGMLLAAFLTDYTYSAGTPNTHTLKPGTTDPITLSLEAGDSTTGALRFTQSTGLVVQSVKFEIADKDLVELTFNLVGCGRVMDWDATAAAFTPYSTYLTNARYLMPDTLINLNASPVTHITRASFEFSRDITWNWVPNGSRWKSLLALGGWSYLGTVGGFWDSGYQVPNLGITAGEFTLDFQFNHPSTAGTYCKFSLGAAQGFLERLPEVRDRSFYQVECSVEGYATSVVTAPFQVEMKNTATNLLTLWT